jgi:hypothetical protein
LSTDYDSTEKYFKTNLINNDWLIVLLTYIQYRTYHSTYYLRNLQPKTLLEDSKEFARKHPKVTAFFTFLKDLTYVSVPWISFVIYMCNAFLNEKTCINLITYTYSLFLIFIYVTSTKSTSNSLNRLIWCWNIGIALAVILFLTILIYQVLCLKPIAESSLITELISLIPTFIRTNRDLLGFIDYNEGKSLKLSIVLLAYVLNFVFAIVTKRHLGMLHKQFKELEGREDKDRRELNRVQGHKYMRWLMGAKWLWPVMDFIAKFMFAVLGFVIILVSIHWRLCIANLGFISIICAYYVMVSKKLIFKPREKKLGDYSSLSIDNSMDVEEITNLAKDEDQKADERVLKLRRTFSSIILAFACI